MDFKKANGRALSDFDHTLQSQIVEYNSLPGTSTNRGATAGTIFVQADGAPRQVGEVHTRPLDRSAAGYAKPEAISQFG